MKEWIAGNEKNKMKLSFELCLLSRWLLVENGNYCCSLSLRFPDLLLIRTKCSLIYCNTA